MTVTPAERAARAAAVAVAIGISNCSNNTSQVARSLCNTAGSSVRPLLAPGSDDDDVLANRVDDNDCGSAALRYGDQPVGADPVGVEVVAQLCPRRVVADGADELHMGAGTRGRHGLIGALAAGCRAHRRRQCGLARAGQRVDIEPDVHIHAADHAHPCHCADVME